MQRFWKKVNKTNSCWLWTAGTRNGYGAFRYQDKIIDAHRMSWFLTYTTFPKDCVCHTCDIRLCVNPEHLFEGTKKENNIDGIKKGRIHPWENSPVNKKGVIAHNRKLTFNKAEQIRKEYQNSKTTFRKLVKKYNIGLTQIHSILHYHTYLK